MRFSTFILTAIAAATSVSAAPAPSPASDASPALQKRAAEVIYLSKCSRTPLNSNTSTSILEVQYYADTANSQNGQVPPSSDRSYVFYHENGSPMSTTSASARYEGIARAHFSASGVDVWWNIETGAYSRAVGVYAGTVSNGFHDWICYRDNRRQLYAMNYGGAVAGVQACNAEFYCMH